VEDESGYRQDPPQGTVSASLLNAKSLKLHSDTTPCCDVPNCCLNLPFSFLRNVLLLDEPTNHLDLDSVYWLEGFLQKQSIPMVIVSHDREFLDRVCNKIVDVEEGTTVSYQGNYSKHLEQKRNRLEVWRDKYEKQVRFVKEEEKWIKKAKNDPNMAQQVKAKETALEKVKNSEDWVEQPPKDKKFRFRFPPAPRCGASVVEANKLTHGYGNGQHRTLFEDVDINVEKGDRVGFVGPNGSGKSTMMRLIMGLETPKSGYTEFGGSNVQANYYQQNQADAMDLDRTVLETVMDGAPPEYTFTGFFLLVANCSPYQLELKAVIIYQSCLLWLTFQFLLISISMKLTRCTLTDK
jgi:ATP-binding cassette, subfamily F, member 3